MSGLVLIGVTLALKVASWPVMLNAAKNLSRHARILRCAQNDRRGVLILVNYLHLQVISWVGDMPRQRAGGYGSRAAEVNFGGGIAHATCEIAVHGCQGALAGGQHAEVAPDAGAATGCADRRACSREDLQVAQAHRF